MFAASASVAILRYQSSISPGPRRDYKPGRKTNDVRLAELTHARKVDIWFKLARARIVYLTDAVAGVQDGRLCKDLLATIESHTEAHH
jgi:hypothetical protein